MPGPLIRAVEDMLHLALRQPWPVLLASQSLLVHTCWHAWKALRYQVALLEGMLVRGLLVLQQPHRIMMSVAHTWMNARDVQMTMPLTYMNISWKGITLTSFNQVSKI